MTIVSDTVVMVGVAAVAASAIGLVRLPDVFGRAHMVATAESLGVALVVVGLLLRPGTSWDVAVRLVMLAGLVLIAAPTATHAITRAARRSGVRHWTAVDRRQDGQR